MEEIHREQPPALKDRVQLIGGAMKRILFDTPAFELEEPSTKLDRVAAALTERPVIVVNRQETNHE